MRTLVRMLAFAAVLLAPGCKKKTTEVVEDNRQNTVEVALQVVAVSPGTIASGRQTTVTIVGAGFVPGVTARVGTQPLPVSFRNANQLDGNVPSLAAGVYDVSVTLPDTTEATLPAGLSVRGGEPGGGVGGAAIDQCRKVVLYFETNSAALTSESRSLLQGLVPCFNAFQIPLQVQGHADERDTTDYNLALGQRRAQSVAQTLAELGVARQRLVVTSFGEERPAERGSDEFSYSKNRRVEILVE
jgi:peptidoglycan-associated lipoprotein